jgi:type IX secretion system PorP/SprF family membrane protein
MYDITMRYFVRYILLMMITALGAVLPSYGQEDATNRQYLFNTLNINPAYAGVRGITSLTAGFHKQWLGIPGSPRTGVFSVDAPFYQHHLGAGLQMYDNKVGLEHTAGANISVATMLRFNESEEAEFLSIGLQAGLMNYRIDRTSVALPYQNDPAFQNNTNVLMPTAGIGLYYQRPGFFASLSAPSLLISTVQVDKILSLNSASLKNMQILIYTGLTARMGDDLQLKPSLFLKWMNGQVFEVHANASLWIKGLVGIGASYRMDDAILGIAELKISNKLSFGYSYGRNIGDKVYFTQATHEAIIRLDLSSEEQ